MEKSAYHRAGEILQELRNCILKAYPISSVDLSFSEQKTIDSEIRALDVELFIICDLANIPSFCYTYDISSYETQKGGSKEHKEYMNVCNVADAHDVYQKIEDSLRTEIIENVYEDITSPFYTHEVLEDLPKEASWETRASDSPEVLFPPLDGDKLHYATYKQTLVLLGPLSEEERDTLLALSQNKAYRKAINAIFTRWQERKQFAERACTKECERVVLKTMHGKLISQAGEWLKTNKESLSELILKVEKPLAHKLIYDSSTGKFSFGSKKSEAISKSVGARKRRIAEKLMAYWGEGKPCPQREIVDNPDKKPPQGFYDAIYKIRKTLKSIGINMPKPVGETYLPPEEPQSFTTVSNHLG